MKTLIIYASYTGVTEDCAKKLSKLLKGETELVNLKSKRKINLNDYETIVIGTSIRAGTINNTIKKLCTENSNALMNKELGIFTCGVSEDNQAAASLEKGVGTKLIKHAKTISHFGGELRMDKLNFLFRFILKKITASQGKKVTDFIINENKIKEFATALNK